MKVIKHDLPTEGVRIPAQTGYVFLPGVEKEVPDELGKDLIARKGFTEVKEKPSKGGKE
jgi:hypothetical protein